MDYQGQGTDLFASEIKIDDTAKRHLGSLVQWSMIVVATAVIGYVVSLIQAFTQKPVAVSNSEGFSIGMNLGGQGVGGTIFSIIIGLLINFFLYQFSVQLRKSVASSNTELLGSSFRNLKIYFIIITIFMILAFLISLIVVLAVM